MWQFRQPAPSTFEYYARPAPRPKDLDEGEVLITFRAGAICGSDIPKFLGRQDPDNPDTGCPGAPLHEVVGTIEASTVPDLQPGDRVVGFAQGSRGLSEVIKAQASAVVPVQDHLDDVAATVIQPLATVINTLAQAPDLAGLRVAVLGLGPLGLLFTQVAKSFGAAHVTGVDRVDRSDVGENFGIDEVVCGEVRDWAGQVQAESTFDVVVEAIGHQQELVSDSVDVLRPGGRLLLFGLPDEHYVFPMRRFLRKNLSLWAGTTRDWHHFLARAQTHLITHPELAGHYVTHTFPLDEVTQAFELYARPARGRIKVALTPPRSIPPPDQPELNKHE